MYVHSTVIRPKASTRSRLQRPLRSSSLPLVSSETQGPLLRSSLAASRDAPELPPEVMSSQGIFFWTSAAVNCKLQFQQTKKTSSYSSNARSCVEPTVSTRSLLANSKAEDNLVSTELLTLQGLHRATSSQQGQNFSALEPALPSLDPQTRNHRHPPSRTGNVELGLDSIILGWLNTKPLTLVTCQMYSGLYKC